MNTIRWLLVAPLACVGVLMGFAVGALLVDLATRLCPEEMLISGMCLAPWYDTALAAAECAGAAVGAFAAVALPSSVAPGHQRLVAALALALGSAYAGGFLLQIGAAVALPFACAIASGLLAAAWRWRKNPGAT